MTRYIWIVLLLTALAVGCGPSPKKKKKKTRPLPHQTKWPQKTDGKKDVPSEKIDGKSPRDKSPDRDKKSPPDHPPTTTVQTVRVVSFNCLWLFDHKGDDQPGTPAKIRREVWPKNEGEYRAKLKNIADVLIRLKGDIYALQEIEDRDVLQDLCNLINLRLKKNYRPHFVKGTDTYLGQNVGIITHYSVSMAKRFDIRVSKHLLIRTRVGEEDVYLLNIHLKAGTRRRSQSKRERQARDLQTHMAKYIVGGKNVIILGDFNCRYKYTPQSSSGKRNKGAAAILSGWKTGDRRDDMIDLLGKLPKNKRGTHLTNRQLDRILISKAVEVDTPNQADLVYKRFYIHRVPKHISDHYALVLELEIK